MLHSATNISREHYLAFAIGDSWTFRVDEYQGLHPDLFETPGRGWHINNNPGASMLAAVPYAIARPLISRVVARVEADRAASGLREPPAYDSPWPMAQAFYAEAWRRGLDVKFGLGALAIQALLMAPLSALAAVGMFFVLRQVFASDLRALWLTLLFALGTPVFFRTGFLNHNLLVGYAAATGFVALWNPWGATRWSATSRAWLAGLAGGLAVLFDYSGVVLFAGLFVYGLMRLRREPGVVRFVTAFGLGAALPLGLLWFYQWASFGDPFSPAQRWMPDVAFATTGYRGLTWPAADLLVSTLIDYRYGLFVSCPLVLLVLLWPWLGRGGPLRWREGLWVLGVFAAFWLFCGMVQYGRLQFNTGIRYMTSMLPLLFLPAVVVLMRLPRAARFAMVMATATVSWSLAMHRDVERGLGVLGAVVHVFVGGFELPALTTIARMEGTFGEFVARGVSPLPLFVMAAVAIGGLWWPRGARLSGPGRAAPTR